MKPTGDVTVELDQHGNPTKNQHKNVKVEKTDRGVRFTATLELLPLPVSPDEVAMPPSPNTLDALLIKGLPKAGYAFPVGLEQTEEIRSLINAKNRQYFYRWRPQNETYLFGFRKHEQGQNAREIPLFDPIVAELEAKIATLRKPKPQTYELIREGEVAR